METITSRIVIDLSLCGADGSTTHHGGGQYGWQMADYLIGACAAPITLVVSQDMQSSISQHRSRHDITISVLPRGAEFEISREFDRLGTAVVLPLPYNFLRKRNIPLRARFVPVVHGLRKLEKAYLTEQGLTAGGLYDSNWRIWRKNALLAFPSGRHRRTVHEITASTREDFSALKQTDLIISPSEHSWWRLRSTLGSIPPGTNRICYPLPGFFEDNEWNTLPHSEPTRSTAGPVLMVSGSRNYKNIVRGLSSLDRAAAQLNRRLPVVVTGIVSSSSEELSARYPNIDLTTLGYVPPSELTKAYKEASLLLYPSLNEGFGIPLVEAMRHGTPIAAAAIASIPEVVGDSALLFNPFDVDEMALRLYQFFEDRGMRERLGVKARSRFQFLQEQARQQWQALARDLDEVDQ